MKRLISAVLCILIMSACEDEILYDFDEQFQVDLAIIDNYLSQNNIDHVKDDSGIRYLALHLANGEALERSRQAAYFFVTIWRLDGTFLGSNNVETDIANGGTGSFWTPNRYDYGGASNYGSLKYFDFIAPKLTVGDRYRVYVPSGLGYGFEPWRTSRDIAPNTNLIVEIEMIEIVDYGG